MDSEEPSTNPNAPVIVDDGPHKIALILGGARMSEAVAAIMARELAMHGRVMTMTKGEEITVITHDELKSGMFSEIELADLSLRPEDMRTYEPVDIRPMIEPLPYFDVKPDRYHPTSPKASRHGERYPRNSGGKKGKRRGR